MAGSRAKCNRRAPGKRKAKPTGRAPWARQVLFAQPFTGGGPIRNGAIELPV
jgi:hypothetical protein